MMIKLTIHITQGPVWYLEDMQFIFSFIISQETSRVLTLLIFTIGKCCKLHRQVL